MSRPRLYDTEEERRRALAENARRYRQRLLSNQKKKRGPRHPNDVYVTPPAFVQAGVDRVTCTPAVILDIGSGDGRWGAAARERWPDAHLIGVELRPLAKPPAYDEWHCGDYLDVAPTLPAVNLVLGNPPYNVAEAILRAALPRLLPGGELVFLLRANFREGVKRNNELFREYPLAEVATCNCRPKFYGEGNGMTSFAYFRWQQDWHGETRSTTAFIPKEKIRVIVCDPVM